MGDVISFAAVRAARQAGAPKPTPSPPPAAPPPARPAAAPKPVAPAPASLRWRQSQAGNSWTCDPRSGIHFVCFQNRRGWSGRATPEGEDGTFVNMPASVHTEAEARAWAEEWLVRQQQVPSAAETVK
jgi:hypothetical protein